MQYEYDNVKGITITFDNEKLFLKTAIIGGVQGDGEKLPMGMYSGSMDIGDVGIAVMHSCRATLKILREMHGLSIEQGIDFIRFCTFEAADREEMASNFEEVNLSKQDIIRRMNNLGK